eukprot:CAMPEP_0119004594 /NCGR_PEP_ID=MMETSP1176-20130426/1236_1 /TAXON_ID=265551 /ORGANISM="Synedropsis recta cf, Strain CCMP1620" /LENGTH=384 /DNA_ID=CAMNT_0006956321 /DNA_START=40 /DNA_END=1194 /DNA_ORIENTATION=+
MMMMRNVLLPVLLLLSGTGITLANQQPKPFATTVGQQKVVEPVSASTATETLFTSPVDTNDADAAAAVLEAGEAEEEEEPPKVVAKNTKIANLVERTGSAVLVLTAVTLLIRFTGATGLKGLILAAQIGMFRECVSVTSVSSTITKCLALATHMMAWDAPHLLLNAGDDAAWVPLAFFGMFMLHIIILVFQQNASMEFGPALRDFGVSHLAAAIVVGLSSTWLGTLTEFGEKSMAWIFFPALLVIVNDTMAYICGIIVGKTKILPTVSPKKTWEGFLGAAIFTVALSKPLWMLTMGGGDAPPIAKTQLFLLAAYVSLVAPFGGFLASTVKRTFGAKDFGAIMPGHGGLVDRLDCQLVTAPFIYLYLTFMGGPNGLVAAGSSQAF